MPLMSLKNAATELGYANVKSIHRLDARGLLKLVRIAGSVRDTLRVNSADVERIKRGDVQPSAIARPQREPSPRQRRRAAYVTVRRNVGGKTVVRHYA